MDALRLIIRHLEAWWAYASRCAQAPVSAPVCKSFWTSLELAAALIGLVVLWIAAKRLVDALAVRQRRTEQARVADGETMAKYRPDSEKLYAGSQGEDVEQRIRQALDERKVKDQWQRPGGTGKKEGG